MPFFKAEGKRESADMTDDQAAATSSSTTETVYEKPETTDVEKGQKDCVQTQSDGTVDDPDVIGWDGDDDPENPYNWPSWRKVVNCIIISLLTFVTPLASSVFAPAVPALMRDLRSDSQSLAAFVVSVYVLGFAFGPLLIAPLSEIYGRTPVYHVCNLGLVAFLVGCALAPNLNALIVFRFLSGAFGSCPLTNGGGSIADMIRQEKRGMAMATFSIGPLIGPIIGPVAGGFLAAAKGWRWIFWVLVIVAGFVSLVMALFMRETYAPVILQRKVDRLRKETGNQHLRSKLDSGLSPTDFFKRGIIRPMKMLIRSPIVALFAIYIAVVYGYLYLLFTSVTQVFQEVYHFSTQMAGLVYLGLGIGSMLGLALFSATSDRYLKKMSKKDGQGMKPEYRLQPLPLGAFLLPVGFLIYGWTTDFGVHWIAPIIGMAIIGIGNMVIFMALQMSVDLPFLFSLGYPLRTRLEDGLTLAFGANISCQVLGRRLHNIRSFRPRRQHGGAFYCWCIPSTLRSANVRSFGPGVGKQSPRIYRLCAASSPLLHSEKGRMVADKVRAQESVKATRIFVRRCISDGSICI